MDQFHRAEACARKIASDLGEDYDMLNETRKTRLRKIGFEFDSLIVEAQDETVYRNIEILREMTSNPKIPKRWLPGIKEAANGLAVLLQQAQEERQVDVPDVFDPEIGENDPCANTVAGDDDPYKWYFETYEAEECGHQGEGGWECTRPIHPDHWQHMDADPDAGDGSVLTTWGTDGLLTSIHPDIVASQSEDDE